MPGASPYNREFKLHALALMRENEGNLKKTAKQLDIPHSTLRGWKNDEDLINDNAEYIANEAFELEIATQSERIAKKLLKKIDALANKDDLKLSEAVGALEKLAKIRLSSNKERNENKQEDEVSETSAETMNTALDLLAQSLDQANKPEPDREED